MPSSPSSAAAAALPATQAELSKILSGLSQVFWRPELHSVELAIQFLKDHHQLAQQRIGLCVGQHLVHTDEKGKIVTTSLVEIDRGGYVDQSDAAATADTVMGSFEHFPKMFTDAERQATTETLKAGEVRKIRLTGGNWSVATLSLKPRGQYYDTVAFYFPRGCYGYVIDAGNRVDFKQIKLGNTSVTMEHSGDETHDDGVPITQLLHRIVLKGIPADTVIALCVYGFSTAKLVDFVGLGLDPCMVITHQEGGQVTPLLAPTDLTPAVVGKDSKMLPVTLLKSIGDGQFYVYVPKPAAGLENLNTGELDSKAKANINRHIADMDRAIEVLGAAPAPPEVIAKAEQQPRPDDCPIAHWVQPELPMASAPADGRLALCQGDDPVVYPPLHCVVSGTSALALPAVESANARINVFYVTDSKKWNVAVIRAREEYSNAIVIYVTNNTDFRSLKALPFMAMGPRGLAIVQVGDCYYLYRPVCHEMYQGLLPAEICHKPYADITEYVAGDKIAKWAAGLPKDLPIEEYSRPSAIKDTRVMLTLGSPLVSSEEFLRYLSTVDLINDKEAVQRVLSALAQYVRILPGNKYQALREAILATLPKPDKDQRVRLEQALKEASEKYWRLGDDESRGKFFELKKQLRLLLKSTQKETSVSVEGGLGLLVSALTTWALVSTKDTYSGVQTATLSAKASARAANIEDNVAAALVAPAGELLEAAAESVYPLRMEGKITDGKMSCMVVPRVSAQSDAYLFADMPTETKGMGHPFASEKACCFAAEPGTREGGRFHSMFLMPIIEAATELQTLTEVNWAEQSAGLGAETNELRIKMRGELAALLKLKSGADPEAGHAYIDLMLSAAEAIEIKSDVGQLVVRSALYQALLACGSGKKRPFSDIRLMFMADDKSVLHQVRTLKSEDLDYAVRMHRLLDAAGWQADKKQFQRNMVRWTLGMLSRLDRKKFRYTTEKGGNSAILRLIKGALEEPPQRPNYLTGWANLKRGSDWECDRYDNYAFHHYRSLVKHGNASRVYVLKVLRENGYPIFYNVGDARAYLKQHGEDVPGDDKSLTGVLNSVLQQVGITSESPIYYGVMDLLAESFDFSGGDAHDSLSDFVDSLYNQCHPVTDSNVAFNTMYKLIDERAEQVSKAVVDAAVAAGAFRSPQCSGEMVIPVEAAAAPAP
ncbi:MAG: hypothetical protein K0U29_08600 [Gammaproteobacteria bacterium]|nr:hypothetical protein [Gammaproteobacteria bacterium]